ncbi:MAG TPA: hypothetical protein VH640_09585 [Bryobacteraceae bacterium]
MRRTSIDIRLPAAAIAAGLLLANSPAWSQQGKNSGPAPRALDGKVDLSGVWVISGSTDLPSDPAYLPAAKKLYEERRASGKSDPEKQCLPNGVVRIEPLPYKIVQTPKLVVLLSEGNTHSYRRFFLDGRPHDLDLEPNTWNGNSIGHWEGDTLVVDSVGFNDKSWLDSTGKPHSEALHVIERYSRPDLNHLEIGYTLDDPQEFSEPYTFTRRFTRVVGRDLKEYFCAMNSFVGK